MSEPTSTPQTATPSEPAPAGTAPTESAESADKPVEQWATGDEPATGPQLSYLQTLAREAGREVPEGLSKADASLLIDELQGASKRVEG